MTLLRPTTLEIQFHKCLITDDPLLPKLRLIGKLPSVFINITGTSSVLILSAIIIQTVSRIYISLSFLLDIRLLQALSIAQSIPLPKDQEELADPHKSSLVCSAISSAIFIG